MHYTCFVTTRQSSCETSRRVKMELFCSWIWPWTPYGLGRSLDFSSTGVVFFFQMMQLQMFRSIITSSSSTLNGWDFSYSILQLRKSPKYKFYLGLRAHFWWRCLALQLSETSCVMREKTKKTKHPHINTYRGKLNLIKIWTIILGCLFL